MRRGCCCTGSRRLSLLQMSIPLGIMLGYSAGILTSDYVNGDIVAGWGSWRVPFSLQGILIVPFGLLVLAVPRKYICTKLQPGEDGYVAAAVGSGVSSHAAGGGAVIGAEVFVEPPRSSGADDFWNSSSGGAGAGGAVDTTPATQADVDALESGASSYRQDCCIVWACLLS